MPRAFLVNAISLYIRMYASRIISLFVFTFVCAVSAAVCHWDGDGHYYTFDGAHFDYEGICKYQAVSCCPGDLFPSFLILAQNEKRGNIAGSFASYVEIVYDDDPPVLSRNTSVSPIPVSLSVRHRSSYNYRPSRSQA